MSRTARLRGFAAAATASCAALAGCKGSGADRTRSSPSAETSVAPAQPPAAERSSRRASAPPPCRAIAVSGEVRWLAGDGPDAGPEGPRIAVDREMTDRFVSLARGARLVVKDPQTSRETTFVGPGRARACVARREESWLPEGHFDSSVGAGEGPGAEEWVITPAAVVRYTAAQLGIDASATRTTVAVGAGAAFVWAPDDARTRVVRLRDGRDGGREDGGREDENDLPWRRVMGAEWQITALSPLGARTAIDACRAHAAEARRLAGAILERGDAGATEVGREVAAQVRQRRLARAACALAAVRLAAAPTPDPTGDADAIRRANDLWANIPLVAR